MLVPANRLSHGSPTAMPCGGVGGVSAQLLVSEVAQRPASDPDYLVFEQQTRILTCILVQI